VNDWRELSGLAALAGLGEGLAIAAYGVVMGDPSPGTVAYGLGIVAAAVAVHLGLWLLLGWLLSRAVRSLLVPPLAISCWILAVAAGRALFPDRTVPWSWWLLFAGCLLVWAPEAPGLRGRSAPWPWRAAGVLAVVVAAQLGRVPDVSYPATKELLFWGLVAGAALGLWRLAEHRLRWALLVVAAPLPLALALTVMAPRAAGPNVLWILIDTTRRDHVQPFGDLVATPAIEKLAAEGVLFEDAVTPVPKTPASVASFLTARYPFRHGIRTLYDALDVGQSTVAEAFRAAGYDTRAFVDNAWLARGRGFGQGFRRFFGYYELYAPYGPLSTLSWVVLADRLTLSRLHGFQVQTSATELTDAVLPQLERRRSRPFFFYVHFFEPHWPYFPPPEIARALGAPPDGRTAVNFIAQTGIRRGEMIFNNPLPEKENESARLLYRGEIQHTMAEVGRLVETLDRLGLGRDTLVVFTADHGHSLGEHDYYFHHGEFLYDDSVRIPLVLRWPGHLPAGVVVRSQVRSIDVAPTVAELARVRWDADLDGRSLARLWREGGGPARPTLLESDVKMFQENTRRPLGGIGGKLRALRDGGFKLIVTPHPSGLELELYDVAQDPGETQDLADDPAHAATRQRLLAELFEELPEEERALLGHLATAGGDGALAMGESELEMLRSLGYIQ
jgi:arylsulfatase A-like enzyme